MGLADREYYQEHLQDLERGADAAASRGGGRGRRRVIVDADGTLGPEPLRRQWFWQAAAWLAVLGFLYFGFRYVEMKREVDRLQKAQAALLEQHQRALQSTKARPPAAKTSAPKPTVDFFK